MPTSDLGHKRIGCLVGPRRYWSAELMIEGWEQGLSERGIGAEPAMISESIFSIEGGRAGVRSCSKRERGRSSPVATMMALGAIAGIRSWGKSVPMDVSVVGFDGTPITAHTNPPLTTIRQPLGRMAGTVSELLIDQVRGRLGGGIHLFTPELVVGKTNPPSLKPRRQASPPPRRAQIWSCAQARSAD